MPASSTITFDDFTGGDYGDKGPHKAAANEWTGRNVMVGQDGCLGPRPGLREHTVTGNVAGDVWGIKYIGQPGKMLLVCIDDTIYSTDVDSGTMVLSAEDALDATPTEHIQVDFYDPNGDLYIVNPADASYVMDWTAGTLAEITVAVATHGFRGIKLYRDRLYLFDDATSPAASNPSWRVYFSEPADLTNFPAENQFDIGYFWDLYAACAIGNHLYFPQRQLGWWALIGGSPSNQILRQTRTDPPQFNASSGASQSQYVTEQGRVWYFRPSGRLATTNGAEYDETSYAHLQLGSVSPYRWGMALSEDGQDILYFDESEALVRHWGTWCFQSFDVDLDGQISNTEFKNRVICVGAEAVGGEHPLYSFDLSLDRPGFYGDTHARPGDDSDTPVEAYFTTPLWRDEKDREFRVRQVIVDFVKYDWGSADTVLDIENVITCTAYTYGRANTAGGETDGAEDEIQEWRELAELSTEAGVRDRARFNFGTAGWGGAFEIRFDLTGCKIEKFDVIVDWHAGGSGRTQS